MMIPREIVRQFLTENTDQPCRAETQAASFASYRNASATTLSGPRTDAAASVARALRIASRPKPPKAEY